MSLKYIFGPAPSRRLGRSLGINVVPSKICSLDCLYCEVGKTKAVTIKKAAYYKASKIVEEFKNNFHQFEDICDIITVTGAGEPTLNSELQEILDGIKSVTDKPVAILTNTTTIYDEAVYNTLLNFDVVVPSLDAVDNENFNAIDKPDSSIDINLIIQHLIKFSHEYKGKIYLEILFCKDINDSQEHVKKYLDIIPKIKLDKVQIGTIHRPPAYSNIEKVSDEFLLETTKLFLNHNIPAEMTSGFSVVFKESNSKELNDLIPTLLKMRPCTIDDLSGVFGKTKDVITNEIEKLLKDNVIIKESYSNEVYYTLKK